jgi:hypothetical protein
MSREQFVGTRALAGAFTLLGIASIIGACAAGEVLTGDGGSTSEGGNGGTTSQGGTTSDGGMGGDGGSQVFPCGIDCSAIQTPDCSVAVCNEGQFMGTIGECVVVDSEDNVACDDGLFCTLNDTCQTGVCMGGPPNDCGTAPPACQVTTCDEASQTCSSTPAANNDPCTPDDLCTVNGSCQNGLCVGTTKDCFFAPVPNECFVATCNPVNGECEPVVGNEGLGCTDQADLCTDNKTCAGGVCQGGAPKDCSALTLGCVEGTCDPVNGQCFANPLMPGQMCSAAADDCNVGICDMMGSCQPQPANEGGMCEDGNSCTSGETCTAGVCGGGTSVTLLTYFSEDFSDNSAGWTLGTTWQIGSAISSPSPGACGNGDPGTDNTPTGDNGLAGAVIGGNVGTTIHPYYYITSPVVDTSTVVGPMWLSFYRWLNSDYTSFMNNTVEVFDGATWQLLWQSGPPPNVEDASWNQQSYDIGAYKNTQMQLRFGYTIGSSGVYTCSGWNLDDVSISNVVCP